MGHAGAQVSGFSLQHLGELLAALGFPVSIGQADELLADSYYHEEDRAPDDWWLLKVPFYYITIADKNLEAAFTFDGIKRLAEQTPGHHH